MEGTAGVGRGVPHRPRNKLPHDCGRQPACRRRTSRADCRRVPERQCL